MPVVDDPGIYKATNRVTNKVYVGSAKNLARRIAYHKGCLRRGKHVNKHLQNSWNKYGDVFTWEVIERHPLEGILPREEWWIEHLRADNPEFGYNKAHAARSDKPSAQMTAVHEAYWASLSDEARAKRLDHFLDPNKNRKTISETMLHKWSDDPEFRAARLNGLDRGRAKTNANPSERHLEVLSGGRAKAIANNKSPEGRAKQANNARSQWGTSPKLRAIRLAALNRGREKINVRKKAEAAARRTGNDIV